MDGFIILYFIANTLRNPSSTFHKKLHMPHLFRKSVLANLYLTLLCCDSRKTNKRQEFRHSTCDYHGPKIKR